MFSFFHLFFRYFTYLILCIWKVIVFLLTTWLIVSLNGLLRSPWNLFNGDKFLNSFDSHQFNVTERNDIVLDDNNSDSFELKLRAILYTVKNSPLWVMLIQIGASYLAYIFAKFASKVQIQGKIIYYGLITFKSNEKLIR